MPKGLFVRRSSPEQEDSDVSPDTTLSTDIDGGVDSLEVELGTAEDGSLILRATSPQRPASELFKFLMEPINKEQVEKPHQAPHHPVPAITPPRPSPSNLKPVSQIPKGPRSPGPSMNIRHGPREQQAQLSPAPRRRQNPPPLPLIPSDFRFRSPQLKPVPLEHRAPSNGFCTGEDVVPRTASDRTVSVASSVHPEIETHEPESIPMDLDPTDPYTPVPKRIIGFRKRTRQDEDEENLPPAAPFRGRVRKYPEYAQSNRTKDVKESDIPSPKRQRPSSPAKGLFVYKLTYALLIYVSLRRPSTTDISIWKDVHLTYNTYAKS